MDLWMDLLFGNPVGLMSMITVLVTIIIIVTAAYTVNQIKCLLPSGRRHYLWFQRMGYSFSLVRPRIRTWTRRFAARPSLVSLLAIGMVSPIPVVNIL
jgi:hypothetical protein